MNLTTECPICKEKPSFTLKRKIYIKNYNKNQSRIMGEYFRLSNETNPEEILSWCSNCKSVYRSKFYDNDEIKYIYNKLYYLVEEAMLDQPGFVYNNEDFLNKTSKKMFEMVLSIEKQNNVKIVDIFDIGGRDGFRLKDLSNYGYNCTVFDPIVCEPCDVKINKEYLWSSQIKKDEKADLIFLCNVLEHDIQPFDTIKNCYDHLRDGGVLYVELPSDIEQVFEWIFFKMWRKKNLHIDNTHYIFYSVKSITFLLESVGFNCIQTKFNLLPVVRANVLGIVAQKSNFIESKISKRLSFDYDLLRSGYFIHLFERLIRKVGNFGL